MAVRNIYVWVPWGCYVPECAFTGMANAARHINVKRNNVQDQISRNGFYKNDEGHLFVIELKKNELRVNAIKNFKK